MKLHELSEQYNAIQDEDLPEEAIVDTLEAIEGEIQVKGENIALLVQNWESDILALTEHKKKIDQKIKSRKNRIEYLKDYLRENMEATGIKKIECPLFSISCVKGRDVVAVTDVEALSDEYIRLTVKEEPDKKKILEDLKAGTTVQGAIISQAKSSIRIK